MKKLLIVGTVLAMATPFLVSADATSTPVMSGHRSPHVAGYTVQGIGWYISNVFPDFGKLVFVDQQPLELGNWQTYFLQMHYK